MPIKELIDGTKYTKATYYNDEPLTGEWELYVKLDGVRALRLADGSVVSRNSKPLHNLDSLAFTDAEIFKDSWNESVSLVRTESYKYIGQESVYQLDPPDPRLVLGLSIAPTAEYLNNLMEEMLEGGHEGLIIRKGKKWMKVVPELQADVRITGYKEGTGKFAGSLGSLQTAHGSVGSGLDDKLRADYWDVKESLIGKIIQVGYRELTAAGKLRFPAFKCMRWDKDEESI